MEKNKNLVKFVNLLKNSYSNDSNGFKNNLHEKNFKSFLLNENFSEVIKEDKNWDSIKKLEKLKFSDVYKGKFLFLYQPFGSQKTPDFIVIIDGWVIWVELKRAKSKKISWNTGYPKDNILYIFDSEKLGRVIFLGKDHPVYGGKEEEYLLLLKKNKKDCERNFEGTVFNHYPRPMLIDCGEYNKELLFDSAKEVLKKLK
jgi:hypothetical protein